MELGPSELILNQDQSIYHLNLHPEDLADTVITVGDPDRVQEVSRCFDHIDLKKGRREFITHTGRIGAKRITVISTGIGTDNIDIVLNELDALVNIDFSTRRIKPDRKRLDIIRLGTSGAIQADIPIDSVVVSEYAIGFDSLMHFYQSETIQHPETQLQFIDHMEWSVFKSIPYVVASDIQLMELFAIGGSIPGFSATNVGFYGPQGRRLRLVPEDDKLVEKLAAFEFQGRKITNLEMETSGIYGLALLLGHKAVSLNCILANRANGEFSSRPAQAVKAMIELTLEKLSSI